MRRFNLTKTQLNFQELMSACLKTKVDSGCNSLGAALSPVSLDNSHFVTLCLSSSLL